MNYLVHDALLLAEVARVVVLGEVHEQRVGVIVALATELAVGVSRATVAVSLFQVRVVLLLRVCALLRREDLLELQAEPANVQVVLCEAVAF